MTRIFPALPSRSPAAISLADRPTAARAMAGLALAIAAGAGLAGCQGGDAGGATEGGDRLQTVATSTILADLTARVGGDEIALVGLLDPGDDPHIYEPVPRDTQAIERAELIFYNGYNLEPALIRLIEAAATDAPKVAVGEAVPPLDMDYEGRRAPDPHVWGDAENGKIMVEAIRDALVARSPGDAAVFRANADRLLAELDRLDAWIAAQIATIPDDLRYLVTTHDAFQYYARAYDIPVEGTLIGISTEEQPSAQTVQRLVDRVRELGVPAIFAETTVNPALIRTVAEEAGVVLADRELYSDALGEADGDADSYVNMLVANTRTLVEALGGTYEPFDPTAPE